MGRQIELIIMQRLRQEAEPKAASSTWRMLCCHINRKVEPVQNKGHNFLVTFLKAASCSVIKLQ